MTITTTIDSSSPTFQQQQKDNYDDEEAAEKNNKNNLHLALPCELQHELAKWIPADSDLCVNIANSRGGRCRTHFERKLIIKLADRYLRTAVQQALKMFKESGMSDAEARQAVREMVENALNNNNPQQQQQQVPAVIQPPMEEEEEHQVEQLVADDDDDDEGNSASGNYNNEDLDGPTMAKRVREQ